MNQYLLNIGRQRNDCDALLTWPEVVAAINETGLHIMDMCERESDTEPTYVVVVADRLNVLPYCRARLGGIARALHQDCIAAVLIMSRHPAQFGDFPGIGLPYGELFGPARDKWAPFNPEFFLMFA